MTSTCRPYFLKMPASLAAHGGTMEPEIDVIATRILRNGTTSAASLGQTSQARIDKARSNRSRIVAHLRSVRRTLGEIAYPTSAVKPICAHNGEEQVRLTNAS